MTDPQPPPSSLFSTYSNASSSYWPPGWNFDLYAHATEEDTAALPDDERAKMQAGFRDVLGEYGIAEMSCVSGTRPPRPIIIPSPPNWLVTWSKRYQGHGQGHGQPWGFVAFRTARTTAAMAREFGGEQFQARVREIVEIPLDAALEEGHAAEEVAEARRTFKIRWFEGEEEKEKEIKAEADLVERLRARYRAMRESESLPPGLSSEVFLCASPSAVTSVLVVSWSGGPGPTSKRWRSGAVPFLLAVAAEGEDGVVDDESDDLVGGSAENDWFKPVFRVAAEVVVDELWLDAIWWSVDTPTHQMRKRRRLFGSE
ncbi:hypothetical protein BDW59DRAFT_177807 [Aspergillus cavernicola]|uniref:Uncharacterized protein n=1 Tax=Aspergillus cavernicola TaxID=176166 RepID=A0ABR4HHS0_9EURO